MVSVFQEFTESSHFEVVEVDMTEKPRLIALSLKKCAGRCQTDNLVKGIEQK